MCTCKALLLCIMPCFFFRCLPVVGKFCVLSCISGCGLCLMIVTGWDLAGGLLIRRAYIAKTCTVSGAASDLVPNAFASDAALHASADAMSGAVPHALSDAEDQVLHVTCTVRLGVIAMPDVPALSHHCVLPNHKQCDGLDSSNHCTNSLQCANAYVEMPVAIQSGGKWLYSNCLTRHVQMMQRSLGTVMQTLS